MLNYCRNCNEYHADMILSQDGDSMSCPNCGALYPLKRSPLFLVTGASGVGKSSACAELYKNETDYVVLESDILWFDFFNTPQDNYRLYREVWLRLCKNISQAGKPVVLCGCCSPDQMECCIERRYFTTLYYLACVCEEDVLEQRMREGRGIREESQIKSSLAYNRWFIEHGAEQLPPITLLDTTSLTPAQAAVKIDHWVRLGLSS